METLGVVEADILRELLIEINEDTVIESLTGVLKEPELELAVAEIKKKGRNEIFTAKFRCIALRVLQSLNVFRFCQSSERSRVMEITTQLANRTENDLQNCS